MVTVIAGSPIVVGQGVSLAVTGSAGPRLRPLIQIKPPAATVVGAGAWVKALITPRGLTTGALGTCAQTVEHKTTPRIIGICLITPYNTNWVMKLRGIIKE